MFFFVSFLNNQKNPWENTYRFPLHCGNNEQIPENYLNRHIWIDPTKIELDRMDSQNRVIVGGLQWKIYLHPTVGPGNSGFALSIIPIATSEYDILPTNYKIHYKVTVSVVVPDNQTPEIRLSHSQLRAQKLDASRKLSYHYSEDLGRLPTDIRWGGGNPKENDINSNTFIANFRSTMEMLPFNRDHINRLAAYDQDPETGIQMLTLKIKIDVRYVHAGSGSGSGMDGIQTDLSQSLYYGLQGAIVRQAEKDIIKMTNELATLKEEYEAKLENSTHKLKKEQVKSQRLFNQVSKLQNNYNKVTKEHAMERREMAQRLDKYTSIRVECVLIIIIIIIHFVLFSFCLFYPCTICFTLFLHFFFKFSVFFCIFRCFDYFPFFYCLFLFFVFWLPLSIVYFGFDFVFSLCFVLLFFFF